MCGVNYLRLPTFQFLQQHHSINTMGKVKVCKAASEREMDLRDAQDAFLTGLEFSIRSAAKTYGVPYGTLPDRLQGAKPRSEAHRSEQLLSIEEEKSIVRFCETLDDLGHPLHGKLVKAYATSLLSPHRQRQLGKHWMTRFLNRNPSLVSMFSQRLDRQRANANDPAILKDFFRKVFYIFLF
jgi:hypothetical protein